MLVLCARVFVRWHSSADSPVSSIASSDTIAASTIISTFNSLTLSPRWRRLLLKPKSAPPDAFQRGINRVLGRFFALFNRGFSRASEGYGHGVRRITAIRGTVLAIFVLLLISTWGIFQIGRAASSPQDKQYLHRIVQLPDAAFAGPHRIRGAPDVAAGEGNPGRRSRDRFLGIVGCRDSSIPATLRCCSFR